MALVEKSSPDRIEVVGEYKMIQVRIASWVEDSDTGEKLGGEKYSRYVVAPGDDVSDKPAEVQQIAATLHTPELIAAYQASLEDPDNPSPPPPAVPLSVTRLQARLALIDAELWDAVTAYFQDPSRTPAEQAFWEDAQNWLRDDPTLASAGTALGLTEEQIDGLFVDAATR